MSIFPSVPELRLRSPSVVHAGESVVAEVLVTARDAVELEWIDVALSCRATSRASTETAYSRELLSLGARIFEGGRLVAGTHALPVRFELPSSLPPSYSFVMGAVETKLRVHASVPWWPDARATFSIPVRAACGSPIEPEPYRVTNGVASHGAPRVELSLASRVVAARGSLIGAVAFFHPQAGALEGAELALIARGRAWAGMGTRVEAGEVEFAAALPYRPRPDGSPVPFHVQLPHAAPPTLRSWPLAIDWSLAIQRPVVFGKTRWLTVPLEIREVGDERGARLPTHDVPPIGEARLTADLARTAGSFGLATEGDALIGALGDVRWRIFRAHDVSQGTVLRAELAYPPLGLGLHVEPAVGLAAVLWPQHVTGVSAFDLAHRIEARDRAQGQAFLVEVAPLCEGRAIERLDDERCVLREIDRTLDDASLGDFTEHVQAVASALDRAIAAIAPPAAIEADLGAWSEVATTLGTRLVAGELSVTGMLGDSEAAIRTELSPDAAAHAVRVRPSPPLPPGLSITAVDPRTVDSTALAAVLATALPDTARDLVIGGGVAALRLPLVPIAEGRWRSAPREALRAAAVLARLGAALAPARGPFR
jgi:hypothetical protein